MRKDGPRLTRGTKIILLGILGVTAAVVVTVYVTVTASIEDDARAAFREQLSRDISGFSLFFKESVTALRSVADSISMLPDFPSRDHFERVSGACAWRWRGEGSGLQNGGGAVTGGPTPFARRPTSTAARCRRRQQQLLPIVSCI